MKTYNIQKHDGNLNKWLPTFTILRQTNIDEDQAAKFNEGFATTGIKYVLAPTGASVSSGAPQVKAGDVAQDGKVYRKVTQAWLDKNPLVTGVKVGDLYAM